MDDQTLGSLRARIAKLEAQLLQNRTSPARRRPVIGRKDKSRRFFPLALAALLMALVPLATLAAGPFGDLNTGSPHNGNIQAIAEAGITKGCDPPDFVAYCPNGLVTREEMASFIARTAGLGGNPPVANAKTAQTATEANNAVYAVTAGTANTLLGYAPNGLVRAAGAADFAPKTVTFSFDNQATARWTPMLATTLTAPGAGYIIVNASINADGVDAACNGTSGTACTFNARLWDGGTSVSPWISTVVNNNGNRYGSVTVSYLFPVAAGSHTITLESSTDLAYVNKIKGFNSTMTALFVPFNGAGNTP